jgi:hypothetical protein
MSKEYSEILIEFTNTKDKFLNFYLNINDSFFAKVSQSCACLERFLLINSEDIFISFNGGKDCLAAYIIIKYYFYCKINELDYSMISTFKKFAILKNEIKIKFDRSIYFIYFLNENAFSEEEEYVRRFSDTEGIQTFYLYSDYISGLKFLIRNFMNFIMIIYVNLYGRICLIL